MKLNLKPIGFLIAVTVLAYVTNKILVNVFNINTVPFKYSVEVLHVFFAAFSIITLVVLLKIKQINIDIVGNTFLLLSSFKMILAYLLVKPILNNSSSNATVEKWHFFSIFIFFLLLETLLVAYLLNYKIEKKAE